MLTTVFMHKSTNTKVTVEELEYGDPYAVLSIEFPNRAELSLHFSTGTEIVHNIQELINDLTALRDMVKERYE